MIFVWLLLTCTFKFLNRLCIYQMSNYKHNIDVFVLMYHLSNSVSKQILFITVASHIKYIQFILKFMIAFIQFKPILLSIKV
uniref:Uncharacterized protein n=1 Tax=Ciona intestinalis TaxID=7719 RepID=H2XP58_CIOIN